MLHGITRQLDDAIHAELVSLGVVPRRDAADGSGGPVNPGAIAARIQRIAERIVGSKDFLRSLDGIAGNVQSFSREQFQRQVRAALGVDLPDADPSFHGIIHGFRQENTALIKTLADDKVSRVRRVLFEAGSSTRVEDIAARLQEETGITDRHAALIARDQVLKLNGAITAKRHADAGITTYIWRTSRDGRVREGHRELEGTRQDPKNPPVVFVPPPGSRQKERRANPGQDFQCRCTMEPVIEGFDDDVPVGGREAGTSSPIAWSPVHGTVEATFKRHGYEPPARLIPPPLAVQHPTGNDVAKLRRRIVEASGRTTDTESRQGRRRTPLEVPAAPARLAPGDETLPEILRRRIPSVPSFESSKLVHEAVNVEEGHHAPVVRAALDIVSRVHRDGVLEPITATSGELADGVSAVYRSFEGVPMSITVSVNAARPHLETLHELGHFIDHSGHGTLAGFASETEPLFGDLMNAIHSTPTVARLRAMREGKFISPSGVSFDVDPGSLAQHTENVRYALENRELFARAYAQFIATESGHPTLRRELLHALESFEGKAYGSHWSDDEFKPIRDEFTRLFRALKWAR